MNAEVAYRYRARKAEVEELGEEAHRRHALQHLKLKTVLKVWKFKRSHLREAGSALRLPALGEVC